MGAHLRVRFLLVLAASVAALWMQTAAQQVAASSAQAQAQAQSQALALTQAMPVDRRSRSADSRTACATTCARTGCRRSGRSYAWRSTAGSVLEDDDQFGLAHMLEHMAFNGTAHFQKQEIVSFMESIGMRFGPSLNAFTSFDETVYMLTVRRTSRRFWRRHS